MAIAKALKILAKSEADLRALVASAADTGDYDAVLRITEWAKQLSAMSGSEAKWSDVNRGAAPPTAKRSVNAQAAYPRFSKRGDQLVKTGWSKREKTEYQHKTPRQVAGVLARAVAEVGKDGRIFQVANLLPLTNSADGSEIPDYQVYLVIAWWRTVGLLDQHGRQGYSLPKPSRLLESVESAWAELPEE